MIDRLLQIPYYQKDFQFPIWKLTEKKVDGLRISTVGGKSLKSLLAASPAVAGRAGARLQEGRSRCCCISGILGGSETPRASVVRGTLPRRLTPRDAGRRGVGDPARDAGLRGTPAAVVTGDPARDAGFRGTPAAVVRGTLPRRRTPRDAEAREDRPLHTPRLHFHLCIPSSPLRAAGDGHSRTLGPGGAEEALRYGFSL